MARRDRARPAGAGAPADAATDAATAAALPFALAARAQRRLRRRPPRTGVAGMAPQPAAASPSQRRGEAAQALARRHLEAAGLRCLAQNLRARTGELDLVMRDGAVLVFVEVRARADARHGGAAASVGRDKQRRLVRTAQVFLQTLWRGPVPVCRFDVVAWEGDVLHWVKNAFDEAASG